MRKGFIIYILILNWLFAGCGDTETVLRFRANAFDGFQPGIVMGDQLLRAEMDSLNGMGEIRWQLQKPAMLEVQLGKHRTQRIYAAPGSQVEISYSCLPSDKVILIGGDCEAENAFIQTKGFYMLFPPSNPRMPLVQDLKQADSVTAINRERLKAAPGLSKDFKKLESERLQLENLQWLVRRMVLRDTAVYLEAVRTRIPAGEEWMEFPGYARLMQDALRRMVLLDESLESEGREERCVEYVLRHIRESRLRAYLLDKNIMTILSVNGVAGNEQYLDIYRENITDTLKLKQLDEVCKKFAHIAVGQPCPDFHLKDLKGRERSLKDFAGKIVYIDLWATWCGPCKGEMPSLEVLEKRFAKRDIVFVSISVDRNKDIPLWKKTVADMKLGGVQLHLGENWDWLKNFMPTGISVPRFILLDREGKILDANMTRPSDKATARKLNELTKK